MNELARNGTLTSLSPVDSLLAELVAEITDRINAGESVNVSAYAARCPGSEERLRELLEAMCLLDRSGATVPTAAGPEGTLGDFRLVREVGRGGMGIVYEAEQISLSRRVALKVLPFAATMDPRHLQRFHNEARAAASLHHPNIVSVHGVGCDRGVHFYAMQFIDGATLAEVIEGLKEETHRRVAESAEKKVYANETVKNEATLPLVSSLRTQRLRGESYYRSVAELGVQAAEALEYAHAMGIVHRDIKPGNLMLESFSPLPASGRGAGGEGLRLWITDFGLAKHGDAGLTLSGDLLGTLRYMSPEQALARHGLVDHRTDIYSLGATLYELLLGRPAVAGDDKQEILRQLAFEEPTAPHKLDPKLPRDLDTVLLKCLDKCPDQRYASAQDLADDLKRWLAHKPVQAKPPTLRTRAGKWVKRNRRIVATAMFVTAALVTATAVSVWQAVEARDAQHEAEGARKQAITDAAIARAVNDFLQQDLLGQAAGDLPQDREMSVSPYLTVKEALDRATSRIGQSFQDQPLVEASIRTTIGKAYQNLAETQLAVPHLERAVSIRKAYLGENHSDTIASMGHLATTYEWVGRKSDAVALRQQIIERHIKHLGNDDPMTLRSQLQLIRSLHSAGRQDWETTTQFMEQLFHKQKAICGPQHPDTLDTMHLLAICYGWLDRFEVSTAMHEALLKLRIEKDGPRNRATVSCMISYAQVCQRAGYLDRAEQLLEEAIAQNQMRDDSLNRREGDANLRGWLAKTLLLQKRYSEAEPLIRNTVSYFEKVHPDSARRYYWISILGAILTGQMKYSEAEPLLLQGYEGMKQREHLIQPNEKCRVEEVGERIVRFYEATGQTENADAWQAKVKPKLPDAASPPSK